VAILVASWVLGCSDLEVDGFQHAEALEPSSSTGQNLCGAALVPIQLSIPELPIWRVVAFERTALFDS
jgi:hypothetical protein